jgi:hypothetical protein
MMVKLKREYTCAPDGHTLITFEVGSEVDGRVADWAIAYGAADLRGTKKKRAKKKAQRKPDEIKPATPDEDKD